MEPTTASVTRSVELSAPANEVWASIGEADGLAGWLGDSVVLDAVEPGAAGVVVDGSTTRRMVVTEVDEGRSIGFVWWDDAAPAEVSAVRISVAATSDGTGSTVTVTERLRGGAVASVGSASIRNLFEAEATWDQRLQALVGTSCFADASV